MLNLTRAEIAFSDGENLVKSMPRGKKDDWVWFFWFNSRITDEELAMLANKVTVLLEYEVIHGLKRKNAEMTTE